MQQTISQILSMWTLYWENGYVIFLFAAACLYLFLLCKKSRHARQLLLTGVLALVFFFFPLSARLLMKMVGEDIYWRILWTIPVLPILCYAGAELVQSVHGAGKPLLAVVCCVLIALTGKDMFRSGQYLRLHNPQQMQDEIPHIAGFLHTYAQENEIPEVYVGTDDHLATWLRVYDPSILLPYGRYGRDALNVYARSMHKHLTEQDGEYAKITNDAKLLGCRFLIVPTTEDGTDREVESYGLTKIGQINDYHIFLVPEDGELVEVS